MIKEKLLDDLKLAMKEKNTNRKNVVQMVRASILQKEKDDRIELSDDQVMEIIAKEHKKRIEAREEYEKANRADLVKQLDEEIKTLEEYLPKKMDKTEIEEVIKSVIEQIGATSMKDMGNVMKEAKARCGLAADGRDINQIAKEMLTKIN